MTSLPQPFYNPQSSPTSTFTQPFVAAPTPVQVQLGQGLEDIGPAFMNFSTTLASFVGRQVEKQNVENVKAGQAKVMQSRQSFRKLVEQGKIDPAANPWEAYGAAQADAIMSARAFSSKLQADYEAEAAKNPVFMDSVGNFDTFANQRIREAAASGVQNPIWVNTFLEEIDSDVTRMSKGHVVEVGRLHRKKMVDGLAVGISSDVGDMMRDVQSLPVLGESNDKYIKDTAKNLQERIDEVAQTIGGEMANEMAIETIIGLRLEYGDDPRIRQVAEQIKTPGGPLHKTTRYKAAEAAKTTEFDSARGKMTIEKRAEFRKYLGQFFTPERIRNMRGVDILEGKGFPAWEEIEGDVRRMGVSADLYEKLRGTYDDMKSEIIREKASDVVNGMADEIGQAVGQKFAAAAGDVGQLTVLAQSTNIETIVADGENQIRLMSRAYGLKDGDAPRTISKDEVRRVAIETAYQSIPRDPNTGVPTRDGLVSLMNVARALDAKYLPSVTPMMRTAVSAWNQPNADATQIPREVMTALEMYEVASFSNEVELLGLPEGERQFLEVAATLRRSGVGLTDAVRRANQLTSGSGKSFKLQEPSRDEILTAVAQWNEEGAWFGDLVAPDATGIGTVEQAIRDVSYTNQLSGMGMAESISQAKKYAAENAVVFEGTVIMAPRTTTVMARNPDAWGAARDSAVAVINKRIEELRKAGRDIPPIDSNRVTFAPRSSSRDNVIFDLIYKEGGNSVDLRYGSDDLGLGINFSYTVDQLSKFVTEESKARYVRGGYSAKFLKDFDYEKYERRYQNEIEQYNRNPENP
jgi:hypothetical protein